ncbi:MAG: alpha/beta fold hydrolase [Clostridia bacterium]|nr:alpha/beta fold hydrolase [Clostridia bacterium]
MEYMHQNAAPFFLEGGENAVLLTHGFTGSAGHMRPLGDCLNQAGFTVQGILLPGHGTSLADMRKSTWQDWLQAELTAVRKLKEKYRTVTVAGLSMGGCLSLIAAEQAQPDACVTISAPMKTQQRFTWAAPIAALVMPEIMWKNGAVNEKRRLDPEYNIGYAGMPTARVVDLNHLMKQARKNLYSVTCPLLSVQSHGDETISADSADIIQREAGSSVKQMLWLEEVPHVCTISVEKDRIAQVMIGFLKDALNA